MDKAGNLYGTTQFGGQRSDGAVFELASDGTETVLGSFDGRNGSEPLGGAIRDRAGNLYGTTARGGTSDDGVVFKLTADGRLKILHSFDCAHDGCDPLAGLLKDGAGNLYGTTYSGGSYNNGTVFELVK